MPYSEVIEKGKVQVFRISQVCHLFVEVVINLEGYSLGESIVLEFTEVGHVG